MNRGRYQRGNGRRWGVVLGLFLAALGSGAAGCASAEREEAAARESGTTVQQFIEVRNEAPESVTVTARVGASAEQRLGIVEPAVSQLFKVDTGAASTDEIFLRARNPRTGSEDTTTLQVTPGQTLSWVVRF